MPDKGATCLGKGSARTVHPVDLIRGRFPALAQSGTACLDNPARTLVPASVIAAVAGAMRDASGNLCGRFAA